MYAVVKTGGKQYRVSQHDTILVEKIVANEGEVIKLSNIVLFDDGKDIKIGKPFVENTHVDAKVIRQTKGKKIIIFKRKRRKNQRRTQGHKQNLTLLKIVSFNGEIKKVKSVDTKIDTKTVSEKKKLPKDKTLNTKNKNETALSKKPKTKSLKV